MSLRYFATVRVDLAACLSPADLAHFYLLLTHHNITKTHCCLKQHQQNKNRLLRHMEYVVELERDFEEFFHVRRKVIVIIAVSILVVYYLLLLLAVVKSLPRAMYRGHGKMAKKQKRDARIAKKDQMALRQFLNPTKYHRALKAYAAYERAKTEKFD